MDLIELLKYIILSARAIDAEDNEFAWPDVSHICDDEMKVLMKSIVRRLYTFLMQGEDPRFDKNMNYHKRLTRTWG
ncbi:MAG: hypothetical protein GKR94_13270 [Gammaproteobacteria bacterium]|nr:hypothetical protein [Gammaproteobacteria bacterium]